MHDGDDRDIEDLLDGLQGTARTERAELVRWLLAQGITAEEIRTTNPPLLLATRHLIGDDGTYVSTREISETYGIDMALLQRVQRAIGLVRVDDPDAAVHMRADGEAAAFTQRFVDVGLDPDQVVLVAQVLAEGLSRAAEVMRYSALSAIMRPGATELEIAKASKALVTQIAPLLGPMIQQMLFMQLRHMMETEAVNAAERAAGKPLPGARQITVAFADLVGFTRIGEAVSPEELGQLANRLAILARDVTVPPVRFVKTIGDAVMFVCPQAAAVARCGAEAGGGRRHRQRVPPVARGSGLRDRGQPGRRLVRQPGQRGQPGHRRGPAGHGAGRRFGLGRHRRQRRVLRLVRRSAPAQGNQERGQTVSRPPRRLSARRGNLRTWAGPARL